MKKNIPKINQEINDFLKIFFIEEKNILKFNKNRDNIDDINLFLDLFLKKVYWSFYLFEKGKDEVNTVDVFTKILNFNNLIDTDNDLLWVDWKKINYNLNWNEYFINFKKVLLDCKNQFNIWNEKTKDKWIDYDKTLLKYKDSYIFPFLYLQKSKIDTSKAIFSDKNSDDLEAFLWKFEDKEFGAIYIMNLDKYILIFSKFDELLSEELILEISKKYNLNFLWLQAIIPSYINRLQNKLDNKESWINEVWIEFPLSMVWGHSYINDKFKDTRTFFNDTNFHNIIKYWLLSKIVIWEDEYNITLSKSNTIWKINLKWTFWKSEISPKSNYIFKISLLKKIEKLLDEVENWKKWKTNWIKSVSLFFISEVFKDIIDTWFSFNKNDDFIFNIEKRKYQVISIIPKYSYEKWNLSYILQPKNIKDNEYYKNYINKEDFLGIDRFKVPNNFDSVLTDLESKYREKYNYVEIKDLENTSDTKRITKNDLLIIVKDTEDNKVCIISYKITEKPFKLFYQVYKLNVNNNINGDFLEKVKEYYLIYEYLFDKSYNLVVEEIKDGKNITNINMKYSYDWNEKKFNSEKNKIYYKWSKWETLEVDWNFEEVEKFIYKGFSYDNSLYDTKKWYTLDKTLKREDLYTLFLSKILNDFYSNKKYYFSWKKTQWVKNWEKFLELADMIWLYTDKTEKTHKSVIELYHMKISPFDSDYDSKYIKWWFSYYTDVLGQILQKVTWLIYEDDIDKIKENINKYKNSYYELIFKEIQKLINKRVKSIKFDFIFPVRFQDYFWTDKMVNEINWTSMKIIYDIFTSNTDNIAFPNNIDLSITLSILVVEKSKNNFNFKKVSVWDFFNLVND